MPCSLEFREGLRRELPAWQSDGIVTAGAARALVSRYDLEDPGGAAAPLARGACAAVAAVFVASMLVLALVLALAPGKLEQRAPLPIAALGAALAAAPLALRGEVFARAAAALRLVGRSVFYLVAFALSFSSVADALRLDSAASPGFLAAVPGFLMALAAVVAGLRRPEVDAHARGEAMLLTATVVAFAAGLFLDTGLGAAVVANLALAFLAAGRIVRGVSWLSRAAFWEGLVVAAVLVAIRVVDIQVAGWPRVTGAFLVAAAAAAAGTVFERRRARAPDELRAHGS